MATINLPKRKHRNGSKKDSESHRWVHGTTRWKKLRLEYMRLHPLCEKCAEDNVITSATQVHHIIPIASGDGMFEKKGLGFDYYNLMALCEACHILIHK